MAAVKSKDHAINVSLIARSLLFTAPVGAAEAKHDGDGRGEERGGRGRRQFRREQHAQVTERITEQI